MKAEARGGVLFNRLQKAKQAGHLQKKLLREEVGLWTCITH